ncbi:hypothetical protein Clacol_000175 [Clathrus columnatus]|uniref:Uncharacterized protein n=1 Tax=Clathrus columnatus TaxID=1419009 RepID=A0AAV4ZXZ5_9AGAM|nr:hypothetical protein Clacol_000175 [Clathrus columnatus]
MSVAHILPGTYRIETIAYPLRFLTQHIETPRLTTAPQDHGLDQISFLDQILTQFLDCQWNLQYVDEAKSIFTLQSLDPAIPPIVSLPNRLQAFATCTPDAYRIIIVHPPDVEAVAYTAEGSDKNWAVSLPPCVTLY